MVFAEYVADDSRGLFVGSAGYEAELVHGVEHAPVDRLETVSHVREGARDDDAHGVIEERFPDFVVDESGKDSLSVVGSGHGDFGRFGAGKKV
jgi:hypothetical protein